MRGYRVGASLRPYYERLAKLPVPGVGAGFHPGMLGVANIAASLGISPRRVFSDLKQKALSGHRPVSDNEILDTLSKAYQLPQKPVTGPRRKGEYRTSKHEKRRKSVPTGADKVTPASAAAARSEVHHGKRVSELEISRLSPVKIPDAGGLKNLQAAVLFEALYKPDEYIFIGNRYQSDKPTPAYILSAVFRKVDVNKLKAEGLCPEFIIPNPLSGERASTKSEKLSYRADSCVELARFVVVEFDSVSLDEQLAFWAYIQLPVAALVTSGNKSIHSWVDLRPLSRNCQGLDQSAWQNLVTAQLKPRLVRYGADPSTFHPARLSRLPGQLRADKNNYQRLLYLNPEPTGEAIVKE